MATTETSGVAIEYEVDGADDGLPLLLIGGLGSQIVTFPDELIGQLVADGYRVIRLDNRDAGLSAKTEGTPPNPLLLMMARAAGGNVEPPPYTLADMADDARAVLDAVGVSAAHVVGISMGGLASRLAAAPRDSLGQRAANLKQNTQRPSQRRCAPEEGSRGVVRMPAALSNGRWKRSSRKIVPIWKRCRQAGSRDVVHSPLEEPRVPAPENVKDPRAGHRRPHIERPHRCRGQGDHHLAAGPSQRYRFT